MSKTAQQEMNTELHNAMRKLFGECSARSERIGALYIESRTLGDPGDDSAALDEQAAIVAEIAAQGVKLAAAFTGMLMVAELSKAVGLSAKDIIEAAATERDANSN